MSTLPHPRPEERVAALLACPPLPDAPAASDGPGPASRLSDAGWPLGRADKTCPACGDSFTYVDESPPLVEPDPIIDTGTMVRERRMRARSPLAVTPLCPACGAAAALFPDEGLTGPSTRPFDRGLLRTRVEAMQRALGKGGGVDGIRAACLAEVLAATTGPRIDISVFNRPSVSPFLLPLVAGLRQEGQQEGRRFDPGQTSLCEALRLAPGGPPCDVGALLALHEGGDFGEVGLLADARLEGDDREWGPCLSTLNRNALAVEEGRGLILSRYPVAGSCRQIGIGTILHKSGARTLVWGAAGFLGSQRPITF